MADSIFLSPTGDTPALLRGAALDLALRPHGLSLRILTSSPHAADVERLTGTNVVWIPDAEWARTAPRYPVKAGAPLVLVDSFPWGRGGELCGLEKSVPVVHLARAVPWEPYRSRIRERATEHPGLSWRVIQHGELETAQEQELKTLARDWLRLAGPLRLPLEQLGSGAPDALRALLGPATPWARESARVGDAADPVQEATVALLGWLEEDRNARGSG